MNGTNYTQLIGTVARIAEADRQLREIKGFVDRSLEATRKFWPALAVAAAGWIYMVTDDERLAMLEAIADELSKVLPIDQLQHMLAPQNGVAVAA